MAESLSWGIVGTGTISSLFVRDLALCEGNRAHAVLSRNISRARHFSAAHSLAVSYSDARAFFLDSDIDVVYIATPPATHHDLAIQALSAGKNVVVEKPMAINADQVRSMMEAAEQAGRFLMEAMWMKFAPTFEAVLSAIHSNQIGDVRSVQASFGLPFPTQVGSRWQASMGGSALLDQGIYAVTLAKALLGYPVGIAAGATMFMPEVDQTGWVTLEYEDGRFAQLASSMVEYIAPHAAVNGTSGYMVLDAPFWATDRFSIYGGRIPDMFFQPREHSFERVGNGFTPMIASIKSAITEGALQHRRHSLNETAETFDLLDEIRAEMNRRLVGRQGKPSGGVN